MNAFFYIEYENDVSLVIGGLIFERVLFKFLKDKNDFNKYKEWHNKVLNEISGLDFF